MLTVSARGKENLEKIAHELSGTQTIAGDLSKAGEAARITRTAIEKMNGLDVLILNTGGPPTGTIESVTAEMWLQGFQSLWLSTVEAIQTALPTMKKNQRGRIILIASTSAREPIPNLMVSNGIRAGLLGMIKTVSNEVAPFGITANVILPGFIDTERLKELNVKEEDIVKMVPMGRLGTPAEIAYLAAFLGSPFSSYITGQAIACDGGRLKSF